VTVSNNVVAGVRRRWQVITWVDPSRDDVIVMLSCGHELEVQAPEPISGNQVWVCPHCRNRNDSAATPEYKNR